MENDQNKKKTTEVGVFKGVLQASTKDSAARIIELLKTGEVDPAYVGVGLKKMEKIAELVKEDKGAKEIIEEATRQYQEGTKKTFHAFGAKITIATRGYWDYSQTEDPVLEAYNDIEKQVKELKKLREEYIQNKSEEWEKMNTPKAGALNFGIQPFNLTFDKIPKLEFEDSVGEVQTNPATKRGQDQFRYSV